MNEKEETIYKVLDFVVEETTSAVVGITAEEITGACKRENVKMARCLFVTQLKYLGYSNATIAAEVHRAEKTIPDILLAAHEYKKQSWAYRVAEAKLTLRVGEIMAKY